MEKHQCTGIDLINQFRNSVATNKIPMNVLIRWHSLAQSKLPSMVLTQCSTRNQIILKWLVFGFFFKKKPKIHQLISITIFHQNIKLNRFSISIWSDFYNIKKHKLHWKIHQKYKLWMNHLWPLSFLSSENPTIFCFLLFIKSNRFLAHI